jgi:ubiquinone/menaquinone biosynthesis C-methylase UbiE
MQQDRIVAKALTSGVVTLVLGVTVLDSRTQDRVAEERQREQWQRVSDILRAMDVRPGAVVGDIGAGDGFFTTRLGAAVGPTGRVFAVDINDSQLDRLRRRVTEEGHRNITVIKGSVANPGLAERTLDAALIVNAYHEMTEHLAMLTAIRSALKPTGRLVIGEPMSKRDGLEPHRTDSRA